MRKRNYKIGLITMHRGVNFGSALQTYATVKLLQSLEKECDVIDYVYPSFWHILKRVGDENKFTHRFVLLQKIFANFRLLSFVLAVRFCIKRMIKSKQEKKFESFINKLPKTAPCSRRNVAQKTASYGIFMTGSDQTWNPRYVHTDYSFLLDFVPEGLPKISYAASFGASKMLPQYKEAYAKYLCQYDCMSVREKSGVSLVQELTGKDACHVLDPTLMLDFHQWQVLNKNNLNLPPRFIFCYILTYVFNPGSKIFPFIFHVANLLNCKVVFYGSLQVPDDEYIVLNDMSPEEFIECYSKAEFVITTSFHGTAFSVNFEKNFFTILNPNQTSDDRVKGFLKAVQLESRGILLDSINYTDIQIDDLATNHLRSQEILCQRRKDSRKYLEEALDIAMKKLGQENI